MPIKYDRVTPARAAPAARMLGAATRRLSDQRRRNALTARELNYLKALRGFSMGPGRSGQEHGVYTRGVEDYNTDLDWTASEILHDSVHAYPWRKGTRYDDERFASEVQAAYLKRIGRPDLAVRAHKFGMNPKAQQARRNEPF